MLIETDQPLQNLPIQNPPPPQEPNHHLINPPKPRLQTGTHHPLLRINHVQQNPTGREPGRRRLRTTSLRQGHGEAIFPKKLTVHEKRVRKHGARNGGSGLLGVMSIVNVIVNVNIVRSDIDEAEFTTPVGDIFDRDVLVVCLSVRADGDVEHAQRTNAELVYAFACRVRCGGIGWQVRRRIREPRGAEFVPIAGEDDDADAQFAFGAPHGVEDDGAFVQETAPGVLCADAPVFGEWDAGGDDFPADFGGFGTGEVGEEGLELRGAEDGGVWLCGFAAVGAGVEHEEGGWAVDEGEVGRVLRIGGVWDGRIHADVVVDVRVDSRWVRGCQMSLGPVIFNLVVVQGMKPGQHLVGVARPRWGRVHAAILAAVVGFGGSKAMRDIDVDEVS